MKKNILFVILLSFIFMCCGCASIMDRVYKNSKQEQQKIEEINKLKTDYEKKIKDKDDEIKQALKDKDIYWQKQVDIVSGVFYGQDFTFNTILSPSRTDIITHNLAKEGWAVFGNQMPSYDTISKMNDRLKKELDEKQTTIKDLEKTHNEEILQNTKLSGEAKLAEEKIKNLEKQKQDLIGDFNKQLLEKKNQLIDLKSAQADLERQRADDSETIKALKTKFSIGLGIFAIICAAGAIYSPIGKGGLAALSAVSGLVAAAIWVITGEMVLYAVLGVIIILIAWGYYRYHTSDKALTGVVNYLHDKGEIASEGLNEWLTKYKKNADGTVVTIPDQSVLKVIEDKLISSDRK